MTGAELDTRRRSLGLSVPEAAEVLGVSVRTASYWFTGDGEPRDPAGVTARLMELEIAMGDIVDAIRDRVNDVAERAEVRLERFRTQDSLDSSGDSYGLPIGAHAMAIAWTADELRAEGHEVVIVWG